MAEDRLVNISGVDVPLKLALDAMDPELKREIMARVGMEHPLRFVDEYMHEHLKRFSKPFRVQPPEREYREGEDWLTRRLRGI